MENFIYKTTNTIAVYLLILQLPQMSQKVDVYVKISHINRHFSLLAKVGNISAIFLYMTHHDYFSVTCISAILISLNFACKYIREKLLKLQITNKHTTKYGLLHARSPQRKNEMFWILILIWSYLLRYQKSSYFLYWRFWKESRITWTIMRQFHCAMHIIFFYI